MKNIWILIAIIVVFGFHIKCVDSIKCYVCNSLKDPNCLHTPIPDSYLKDCSEVDKHRFERNLDAVDIKIEKEDHDIIKDNYGQGYRSSQCSKIKMDVEEDGKDTVRVFRNCSGIACKGDPHCRKSGTSKKVKKEQCYCETDGCNSSHRRLHPYNIWFNILVPIVISLSFVFN